MKDLEEIKQKLLSNGFEIDSEKIIHYGIQYRIKGCGYLRIYWRKDGQTTVDLSQIKSFCLQKLSDILNESLAENDLEIQKRILRNLPADPKLILPAIGSDEAGKGDTFGPLVVAAVYVGKNEYAELNKYQLKDSKSLSDKKVLYLADQIKSLCTYSVATVEPEDFAHIQNMNALLEELHARCIMDVINKKPSLIAVYDDFGAKNLKERLKDFYNLTVLGFVKAERNPAVAAASIVARAEFLSWINRVSDRYGVKIPLGSGEKATEFARDFLKRYGLEEFRKLAKVNFSNVRKLIISKPTTHGL